MTSIYYAEYSSILHYNLMYYCSATFYFDNSVQLYKNEDYVSYYQAYYDLYGQ